MQVLVADDDPAIRKSLARVLRLVGYDVVAVENGVQAIGAGRDPGLDVIVLDVMMPGVDGLGVCEVLRDEGIVTPILMLTARVETPDRVAGLDAGADDYLAKPFDVPELLARLRALVRRTSYAAAADSTDEPTFGELQISPATRKARWGKRELPLAKTEFDLLELLVRNSGQVLTHSTIYERIWRYDFGPDSNNLAVYISYLRRKLEDAGAPDLIRNIRGVGYGLGLE